MGHTLQLIAAILLTVVAVMMFIRHGGREPGFNRGKQAGLLFGLAAAINWALYLRLLD